MSSIPLFKFLAILGGALPAPNAHPHPGYHNPPAIHHRHVAHHKVLRSHVVRLPTPRPSLASLPPAVETPEVKTKGQTVWGEPMPINPKSYSPDYVGGRPLPPDWIVIGAYRL